MVVFWELIFVPDGLEVVFKIFFVDALLLLERLNGAVHTLQVAHVAVLLVFLRRERLGGLFEKLQIVSVRKLGKRGELIGGGQLGRELLSAGETVGELTFLQSRGGAETLHY